MEKRAPILYLKEIKLIKSLISSKKTVLAGGCFDLLHFGHVVFLKKAKELGDFLIIALESDKFIRIKKRAQPVHNQRERAEILSSLRMVDLVILLPFFSNDEQYLNLVKIINPKIIAVTEGDPLLEKKRYQAKLVGGELKIVTSLLKKFSTRKILSSLIRFNYY